MGDYELMRWETNDMAAARQQMAGRPRRAAQIDRQVRERAAAQRLMAKETRLDEELPAFTSPVRRIQPAHSLLAGFTRVFMWLMGQ